MLLINVSIRINEISQRYIYVPNSTFIYHEQTPKGRPSEVAPTTVISKPGIIQRIYDVRSAAVTPTDQGTYHPVSCPPKRQRICTNLISHPSRAGVRTHALPDSWLRPMHIRGRVSKMTTVFQKAFDIYARRDDCDSLLT